MPSPCPQSTWGPIGQIAMLPLRSSEGQKADQGVAVVATDVLFQGQNIIHNPPELPEWSCCERSVHGSILSYSIHSRVCHSWVVLTLRKPCMLSLFPSPIIVMLFILVSIKLCCIICSLYRILLLVCWQVLGNTTISHMSCIIYTGSLQEFRIQF